MPTSYVKVEANDLAKKKKKQRGKEVSHLFMGQTNLFFKIFLYL